MVWREAGAVRNAPSEPRLSGVHPEEGEVGKAGVALRLGLLEWLTMGGPAGEEQCLGVVKGDARVP